MKRVILMIMDSMGVGEEPDAPAYGDAGANTFLHAAENTEGFRIPNLQKLGLGNIENAGGGNFVLPKEKITGSFGRMREMSRGKDTITGHWEICGIETLTPFKTYPDGFPKEFIEKFEAAIGTEVLGNYPASGTVIIEELGDEHEATGKPIVYTSADSVFQIAANTDVIPLERLYEICETARGMLVGDWACGRVIARPYIRRDGKRIRTADRRDYAVAPPEPTLLDKVSAAGQTVYAVGKIHDIFDGQGCTVSVHTDGNMDGVDKTLEAMKEDFGGLIFTNLVDFDSLYGHRRNPSGYGRAIMDFDKRIPEILAAMKEEDILVITADHGNDPVHSGFDHTREYVPVLICGAGVRAGVDIGTRKTFADCGRTIAEYLGVEKTAMGESFLKDITE
ncbi:phosphopentomutase [Hornefia porci]|uniref:Phosphopentomutase n=1 Tax=Hornefia porci TaxID=2652292 RepID=A0A1Q9JGJ4_9FIRM|nr:phosphopentomutase [Hornefia porci]OLR55350.1 phosphopentomutase [Hornefia porci]